MFTKVDERLWSDEKYRKLSDDGKLLFIYVLACSHRNMIGLYLLPVQYGSYDLNWKEERFNKGLVELSDKSFIKYNFNTNIVYIKNFLKYNPLENPNQVKGAIKVLESIPTNAIDTELIKELERADKPFNKPLIELLYKGLGKQEEVEVEVDEEVEVLAPKIKKEDCFLVIEEWNKLGLTQLSSLNSGTKRYDSLKARISENSLETVLQTIGNIENSSFLKGNNDKNWVITFDWFVLPNNFIKVLEGNYMNNNVEVVVRTDTKNNNPQKSNYQGSVY